MNIILLIPYTLGALLMHLLVEYILPPLWVPEWPMLLLGAAFGQLIWTIIFISDAWGLKFWGIVSAVTIVWAYIILWPLHALAAFAVVMLITTILVTQEKKQRKK